MLWSPPSHAARAGFWSNVGQFAAFAAVVPANAVTQNKAADTCAVTARKFARRLMPETIVGSGGATCPFCRLRRLSLGPIGQPPIAGLAWSRYDKRTKPGPPGLSLLAHWRPTPWTFDLCCG